MRNLAGPLRGVLVSSGLVGLVCVYVAVTCLLPVRERPIYGDFRVRYAWDKRTRTMEVHRLGTPEGLSWPVEKYLIPRLVKRPSWNGVLRATSRQHVTRGYADADVRVYGNIVPCSARLLGVGVTNADLPPGVLRW
jgi:hypothetical protein